MFNKHQNRWIILLLSLLMLSVMSGTVFAAVQKPANFKATISGNEANGYDIWLTWDALQGAAKYQIDSRWYDIQPWSLLFDNVTQTTVGELSIRCGVTLYYRLYAIANDGTYSAPAYTQAVTPACSKPPAKPPFTPYLYEAKGVSPTEIKVSWIPVQYADQYKIEYTQGGNAPWEFMVAVGGNDSFFTRGALKCNTSYAFRIYSVNKYGNSVTSDVVAGKTLPCIVPPTGVQAQATSNNSIKVTWNDLPNESKYHVEGSNNGNDWQQLMTMGINMTSYTQGGLPCNTKRYYRVRMENQFGISAYSSVVNATTLACDVQNPSLPFELVSNGDFETNIDAAPNLPDGWNGVGKLKGDKLVDNSGSNEFQLKGTPKEASHIQQDLNLSGKTLKQGDMLRLYAAINQQTGKSNRRVVEAIITFKNGDTQRLELVLAATPAAGWAGFTAKAPLQAGDVDNIQVRVGYNAPMGTLFVDNVSFKVTPMNTLQTVSVPEVSNNAANDGGLIPVPAAPTDLRGN